MAKRKVLSEANFKEMTSECVARLKTSDDLGCAAIAAAHIDHYMGMLIQKIFSQKGSTADSLLQPGGPLGEYASRAKLLYCLGGLSTERFNAIIKIAEIRNELVHNFFKSSFNDPEIKKLCYWFCDPQYVVEQEKKGLMHSPRQEFIAMFVMASASLLLANACAKELEIVSRLKLPLPTEHDKESPG